MTIRSVATIMLMVLLVMPAVVHAHTLELLGTETTHAAGGCHGSDNGADQDTSGDHQFDVSCCELDTPYVLPSSNPLATPAVTGKLVSPFNGRQLEGYASKIYKPPR